MNFISKLTGGQIFCIAILGFMVLVMELFSRQTIDEPWQKVAIRWIFRFIGYGILFRGLSELKLGRWIGVGWVLVGAGVTYLTGRGRIEKLIQKKAEKDERRA